MNRISSQHPQPQLTPATRLALSITQIPIATCIKLALLQILCSKTILTISGRRQHTGWAVGPSRFVHEPQSKHSGQKASRFPPLGLTPGPLCGSTSNPGNGAGGNGGYSLKIYIKGWLKMIERIIWKAEHAELHAREQSCRLGGSGWPGLWWLQQGGLRPGLQKREMSAWKHKVQYHTAPKRWN